MSYLPTSPFLIKCLPLCYIFLQVLEKPNAMIGADLVMDGKQQNWLTVHIESKRNSAGPEPAIHVD